MKEKIGSRLTLEDLQADINTGTGKRSYNSYRGVGGQRRGRGGICRDSTHRHFCNNIVIAGVTLLYIGTYKLR